MIQERTENFLAHHGILGMKWGVRRFQDKSGKRTAAGKKRDSQISKRVKAVGTRLKETGKMMKNQVVDPGSYAKATREMYKKDGTKKALRRTFAYQKTSEIKDFNKSVAEIRSNKSKTATTGKAKTSVRSTKRDSATPNLAAAKAIRNEGRVNRRIDEFGGRVNMAQASKPAKAAFSVTLSKTVGDINILKGLQNSMPKRNGGEAKSSYQVRTAAHTKKYLNGELKKQNLQKYDDDNHFEYDFSNKKQTRVDLYLKKNS